MSERGRKALDVTFYCNDLDRELSLREWFAELLMTLWREADGFSGKRPFGNSGWWYDPIPRLIDAGLLSGRYTLEGDDGHGYIEDFDTDMIEYDRLIVDAMDEMGQG